MTFKYTFRVENEGTTVPYPPVKDDIRDNRGFVDLRGRPERANEIAESMASPALRNLLRQLASSHSPIFTLGCDLGSHVERANVPASRRVVAGGYVHIAGAYYDRTPPEAYAGLANSLVSSLKNRSGNGHWKVDFVGTGVNFQFDGEPTGIRPTLWIWFFASARDEFSAIEARERLIAAIADTLVAPAHLEPFTAKALGT